MSIFNVFTLMGGIAMFLYGMDLMGKALEQTAGSKELYVTPANASPAKQIHKSQETTRQKGAAQPVKKGGSESGCQ